MRFHIVGTQEVLISHPGLVLAGALLQATQLKQRLHRVKVDSDAPNFGYPGQKGCLIN